MKSFDKIILVNSKKVLRLKNVNHINVKDNYFIINQENGKVFIYKQ